VDGFQETLLPAIFGSAFQELLYWYDLRSKLDADKYDRMWRSPAYWIITFLMVVGSAYGTTIWFEGQNVGPKDFMIVSAAFPLLFKKGISAANKRVTLGAGDAIRSYFRGG
jgi:hypothetical protein